uniref:Uncharacterized protein n=1 Tax=Schlesneria paludicola TaxID=360056 RepID=A0A7C2K2B2_9PLAN
MSDPHAGHGAAVADHPDSAVHATTADALRFEKVELEEFQDADRGAGQHIGILLAFLFCVLLVLMSSATLWTYFHQSNSDDPHAKPAAADHGGH